LSHVAAPWFGGPGFYARVALLGALALTLFAVLGLRLWSLQVLHSAPFRAAATRQATRSVLVPAPRGPIVDVVGRPLVETGAALGAQNRAGVWRPNRLGRRLLAALAALTHTRPATLVARVQTSVRADPFAPAVVVPHAS